MAGPREQFAQESNPRLHNEGYVSKAALASFSASLMGQQPIRNSEVFSAVATAQAQQRQCEYSGSLVTVAVFPLAFPQAHVL
jgi:hypothetical protein